jgi:hypothetical protein
MTSRDPGEGDGGDLAAQLTRKVERWVGFLTDRAVRPVLLGAAGAVVAVAALLVGLAVLVAIGDGLLTLFNVDVFGDRVWATDFLFGGMLSVLGLFLLRRSVQARRSDGGS